MKTLRAYAFPLLLMVSIVAGLVLGRVAPVAARTLRPLGDLFLNLIFMIIVPLVFFTIASSVASTPSTRKLSRMSGAMILVFVATSLLAAVGALAFLLVVQPAPGAGITLQAPAPAPVPSLAAQLVGAVTASDFPELVSRKSMLPLIVFSALVGFATLRAGDKGEPLARVLASGARVCVRVVDYVMYLAPVGLLAWFSATVADTGDRLATAYVKVFLAYYVFAGFYYVAAFTLYAWLGGRGAGVRRMWAHMLVPSVTALGTCSSMATLPVNLEAAERMGVPRDVRDLVLPVGAALHKDGSVIGGMLKVLFAMSLFHQELTAGRVVAAIGVAVLVGVVMGAIPSGGMMGELLILSVFGFPPETLPLLAVISIIIDPGATLLNAAGDNPAAMMVTRMTEGNLWSVAPLAVADRSTGEAA